MRLTFELWPGRIRHVWGYASSKQESTASNLLSRPSLNLRMQMKILSYFGRLKVLFPLFQRLKDARFLHLNSLKIQ